MPHVSYATLFQKVPRTFLYMQYQTPHCRFDVPQALIHIVESPSGVHAILLFLIILIYHSCALFVKLSSFHSSLESTTFPTPVFSLSHSVHPHSLSSVSTVFCPVSFAASSRFPPRLQLNIFFPLSICYGTQIVQGIVTFLLATQHIFFCLYYLLSCHPLPSPLFPIQYFIDSHV